MVVDELVTILGLRADPNNQQAAQSLQSTLKAVKVGAAAAVAAVTALAGGVVAFVSSVSESEDAAGKFADSIGVSYEALQELEFAAQRSGNSIEDMRMVLGKLSTELVDAKTGKTNEALARLGLSALDATGKLKPADQMLGEISAKFETLGKAEQVNLAKSLGIKPQMVKLLQQGADGLAALRQAARETGAVLPEEAKKRAADYNDSLLDLQVSIKAIGRNFAVHVMPGLTEAFKRMQQFVSAARPKVVRVLNQAWGGLGIALDNVTKVVGGAWRGFKTLLAPLERLLDWLPDLDTSTMDLSSAIGTGLTIALGIATAAAWGFIAPFLPIIATAAAVVAAIALVVLIIDDLWVAFQGGNSVVGALFDLFEDKFPNAAKVLRALATLVKTVVVGQFERLKAVIDVVVSALETAWAWLGKLARAGGNWLKKAGIDIDTSAFVAGIEDATRQVEALNAASQEALGATGQRMGGYSPDGAQRKKDFTERGPLMMSNVPGPSTGPTTANVPPTTLQQAAQSFNTSNTTTIHVNGAGNPMGVASEIARRQGGSSSAYMGASAQPAS
ncbi:MAG: phage tail tape measure protein [Pseudomonas sp.]|uniref:phage tail tape measure protein n=1 Tax=Pseudomonas sp. TaxID=306 RepID=UPI00235253EE|nr:phage tail tape measure protein [Pseudomonas sp.]MBS5839581.1 phage tail tape measure protein [Pseudomonas sp.]